MSQSGTRSGGSSGEDERPTNRRFNSKDWVGSLHDYLTSTTDRHPGDPSHPSGDWFGQGVEMAALDQGRAVTSTPKQGILKNANGAGGQRIGGPASSQQSTPW